MTDIRTTRLTPAWRAAQTALMLCSGARGLLALSSQRSSTPSKAPGSDSGVPRSATRTCTPRDSMPWAFASSRTSARTSTSTSESASIKAPDTVPVAPVIRTVRLICVSLEFEVGRGVLPCSGRVRVFPARAVGARAFERSRGGSCPASTLARTMMKPRVCQKVKV